MKAMLSILVVSLGAAVYSTNGIAADIKPLNLSKSTLEISTDLRSVFKSFIATDNKLTKDAILKSLPNSDTYVTVLDSSESAQLGFLFFSGGGSNNISTIVQEYSLYRDDFDCNSKTAYRTGIAIRLIVEVNEKGANISTSSIAALAAKAEAKELKARVRLQTLGVTSKEITKAIEIPSELNFTTLRQLYQAFDVAKNSIWESSVSVSPQLIGISTDIKCSPAGTAENQAKGNTH